MRSENPHFNLFDPSHEGKITSPLREATRGQLQKAVEHLHEIVPGLTPNQLTFAGAVFGVAGALIAHRANMDGATEFDRRRFIAAAFMVIGIALDGFDGPLARCIEASDQNRPVLEMGSIYNSAADTTKEVVQHAVRIAGARERDDSSAEKAAVRSGLSNRPSQWSYWRTIAEGIDNSETGNNFIQAFGLHTVKIPLGAFATAFPVIKNIPVQELADNAMAIGNAVNIVMNSTHIGLPAERTLGDKARKVGELRRDFHVVTSLATAGIIFGTEVYLDSKHSKESASNIQ